MTDREEAAGIESDNVALRKEMLRYNVITDGHDRYMLGRMLAVSKMLVPVFENKADPDAKPQFGTMYKHEKGIELHVFTSVTLVPETCEAQGIVFYPFATLLSDMIADGKVTAMRVDPGTDHGVGFLITDGKPTMFRLKRIEDRMAKLAGDGEE